MKLVLSLAVVALCLSGCSGGGEANSSTAAAAVPAKAPPAGKDWTEVVSKTDEGYRMGNPDAPIKLVEYGSRLCPTCGAFAREGYEPLTANYVKTGKVSFEFREFLVHGAPDLPPALLGTCMGEAPFFPILEGMYRDQKEFNDKLMAMPEPLRQQIQSAAPGQAITMMAEQMGLVDYAKQRGIPEAKARACLADMNRINALTKQTQDKTNDGTVSGTPTFLINGSVAQNVISWSAMETALKAAGA